jgi:hypothetical protein
VNNQEQNVQSKYFLTIYFVDFISRKEQRKRNTLSKNIFGKILKVNLKKNQFKLTPFR